MVVWKWIALNNIEESANDLTGGTIHYLKKGKGKSYPYFCACKSVEEYFPGCSAKPAHFGSGLLKLAQIYLYDMPLDPTHFDSAKIDEILVINENPLVESMRRLFDRCAKHVANAWEKLVFKTHNRDNIFWSAGNNVIECVRS